MPTTTENNIHGHEILYAIHTANPPFTRATLAEHVGRRFGPDPRFCTCSGGDMTLDELLHFLLCKGKIVETPAGELVTDVSKMCSNAGHEHHHD